MRLFVTGATGLIGSHLINAAFDAGHEVVALKRTIESEPRIQLVREPEWIIKPLDKLETKDFIGIDSVIHLAAHSMYPPLDTLANCLYWNVTAPVLAFHKAISAGVSRFAIAGSCSEYGLSGEKYDFIPIEAPLLPTASYGASKAAASIAFYQMALEFKLSLSYHRIFQVYGEGEAEFRLWPSLQKAAKEGKDFPMTLGEQIRDFVHVSHVCKVILDYCSYYMCKKPIIKNLGSGQATSVLEFSRKWWTQWNASGKLLVGNLPYRKDEVMRLVPVIE